MKCYIRVILTLLTFTYLNQANKRANIKITLTLSYSVFIISVYTRKEIYLINKMNSDKYSIHFQNVGNELIIDSTDEMSNGLL